MADRRAAVLVVIAAVYAVISLPRAAYGMPGAKVVADARFIEDAVVVDSTEFLNSLMTLKLRRAVFPSRQSNIVNDVLTLSYDRKAPPRLGVFVPTEDVRKGSIPSSVQVEDNRRVSRTEDWKQGKNIEYFATVDLEDLTFQTVGATQQLVKDLYRVEDILEKERESWIVKYERIIMKVQFLDETVRELIMAVGSMNSTLLEQEVFRLQAAQRLLEAQEAIANFTLEREKEHTTNLQREEDKQKRIEDYASARRADEETVRKQNEIELANLTATLTRETTEHAEHERLRVEKELIAAKQDSDVKASEAAARIKGELAAKQERDNEDVRARLLREQGLQDRRKWREAIAAASNAFLQLLSDRHRLTALVVALSAIFLGLYAARELSRVGAERFKEWLYKKPALVRETSRQTVMQRILARLAPCFITLPEKNRILEGVVLHPALEARVSTMISAIELTARYRAPLRHVLFQGPPGTGKTMVARRVALHSGLDFAIMSGGDVAPLKSRAVTEIHKLVNWAKRSARGMLLFIDEAEAFVGSRETSAAGFGPSREALNALLYHTGQPSNKFMMILATNRPEDLDSAITDRIDDALVFPLPGREERRRLALQYFGKYVGPVASSARPVAGSRTSSLQPTRTRTRTRGRNRRATRARSRTRRSRANKQDSSDSSSDGSEDEQDGEDTLNDVGYGEGQQFKNEPRPTADGVRQLARGILQRVGILQAKMTIQVAKDVAARELERLADQMDGFSGREIEKLMLSMQARAHANHMSIDLEIVAALVADKIEEHAMKVTQRSPVRHSS